MREVSETGDDSIFVNRKWTTHSEDKVYAHTNIET